MVLDYVAVMARPVAFNRNEHNIVWSHLYTDITVSKHMYDDNAVTELFF